MAPPPAPSLHDVIHLVEADTQGAEPLGRLEVASLPARHLAEVGDAALGYFVDQARLAGHTWSEIGEALGVSKQAAQQKHTVRLSPGFDTPTLERYTPRARNVLSMAEPLARRRGDSCIGTEHLLLALYEDPDAMAARILTELGLNVKRARAAVDHRAAGGPGAPAGTLPFTPQARAVLTGALASALQLGHNYIGTEHLLLGLFGGDGVAARTLKSADLSEEKVVSVIKEMLAGDRPRRATAGARRTPARVPRAKRESLARGHLAPKGPKEA
jgi:hypothetical protein